MPAPCPTAAAVWLAGVAIGLLSACTAPPVQPEAVADCTPPAWADSAPPAPREWRAAWVATVDNIDWPSRPGLDSATLQREAITLLDLAQRLHLNTLLLQVRPSADAFYPSTLEPWSEFLSGRQGQPPGDNFDPLAYWLTQARQRGLSLQAWFNPYRARRPTARSAPAPLHISQRRPDLVRSYGDQLWLDPGEPEAAAHTRAVIRDVATRYDIDGVHLDDYFYPYPVKDAAGRDLDFPDDASWQRDPGKGRGSRAGWRRTQVNSLLKSLNEELHQLKPWLAFTLSPFGIGRPDRRPAGVTGFSQYDGLYADVEHWLAQGWLDALVPQLYWPIDSPGQPFGVLLDYWQAQNPLQRPIWPGLYTGRLPVWPAQQIVDQIRLTRERQAPLPAGTGHAHFSLKVLAEDRDGITRRLAEGPYAAPALAPAMPWLAGAAPPVPRVQLLRQAQQSSVSLHSPPADETTQPRWWAVWWRLGSGPGREAWRFDVQPAQREPLLVPDDAVGAVFSAVGRTGLESRRIALAWADGRQCPPVVVAP